MKKMMMIAIFGLFANTASATVAPALIEEIPQSVFASLEASIKASAQKRAGFSIKDFRVDWNGAIDCLETKSELNEKRMGVCTVGFGGFQVSGNAAILVKDTGYSISVINVDVE